MEVYFGLDTSNLTMKAWMLSMNSVKMYSLFISWYAMSWLGLINYSSLIKSGTMLRRYNKLQIKLILLSEDLERLRPVSVYLLVFRLLFRAINPKIPHVHFTKIVHPSCISFIEIGIRCTAWEYVSAFQHGAFFYFYSHSNAVWSFATSVANPLRYWSCVVQVGPDSSSLDS